MAVTATLVEARFWIDRAAILRFAEAQGYDEVQDLLENIALECGLDLVVDETTENVVDIAYDFDKYTSSLDDHLGSLAPYVRAGSFIVLEVDHVSRVRYAFDGTSVRRNDS